MNDFSMMNQRRHSIGAIALLAILAVTFHLFMDWLFFVTKASFLASFGLLDQIAIFLASPLLPALIAFALVLLIGLASPTIARVIPALILAATLFILIDNFTVTLFQIGVRSSFGVWKILYLLLFAGLIFIAYRWMTRWQHKIETRLSEKRLYRINGIVIAFMLVCTMIGLLRSKSGADSILSAGHANKRMNVLLIGGDGINADRTSLYGYDRDTTPFLREFAKESLACDNVFANAAKTLGSITSILTGKLPTETRVIRPPDVLMGKNSYQHLPGILKNYGYATTQLTIRKFADAYDSNMRMAFDSVNSRELGKQQVSELGVHLVGQEAAFFLQEVGQRLVERFQHILGIRDMVDSFAQVEKARRETLADHENVEHLLNFIQNAPQPFFAHIHLMATHDKHYPNRIPKHFGLVSPTIDDLYDDALFEVDSNMRQIFEFLRKRDLLKDTLVIIYSDHGMKRVPRIRVPLLIRFPQTERIGHFAGNVQNLDIAPTILDFLNIPKPGWMEGTSIISGNIDNCRWIFHVAGVVGEEKHKEPGPFASMATLSAIHGDQFYRLDVRSARLESGMADRIGPPCKCKQPTETEVLRVMFQHLEKKGWDASSLKKALS
jgi:arylsulfatase A-like enzyme